MKKKRHAQDHLVLTVIVAILSLAFGYAAGAMRRPVFFVQTPTSVTSSTGTALAPAVSGAYATDKWKTWRDGEYRDGGAEYRGYEVSYPRDFDVSHGDQVSGGWLDGARVKIGFPEDAFSDTKNNFSGAVLLVSVADDMTERECYTDPYAARTGGDGLLEKTTVNGTTYRTTMLRDAAAGNRYDTELYRLYHDGRCNEIALLVHTGNIGNYQPGVEAFDNERAFTILREMLATFRLLDEDDVGTNVIVPAVLR